MVKFAILFVLCSGVSAAVFANEHGEAPAAEHEGGGEHGAKEAVTLLPWAESENKVQELSARISSKRTQLETLLEEKKHAREDSPEVKTIVDTMVKEHKELNELIADYEKNLNLLKYRFPERSAKTNRLYKKIETESLDEIENEMGVDGKLSRNLVRMRQHFGTKVPNKARVPAAVGSEKRPEQAPVGSIENPTPIIIKK